ncbi:hypothetical protein NDU88_002245 [Pleurodeles waltl]|uniref:Uncharacterized protein n=1 Tax=Pleurodeles waltl TaxID=8319 RepID=A0AAV7M1L3_PLEWA|nr:hypothetical protein NDU88_002245 [Pleurodeles waltl]
MASAPKSTWSAPVPYPSRVPLGLAPLQWVVADCTSSAGLKQGGVEPSPFHDSTRAGRCSLRTLSYSAWAQELTFLLLRGNSLPPLRLSSTFQPLGFRHSCPCCAQLSIGLMKDYRGFAPEPLQSTIAILANQAMPPNKVPFF